MGNLPDSLVEFSERFDPATWVILRLDGRGFTNRARAYARPFDPRFHEAMRNATEALLAETPAAFAHTASDEISLFFAPGTDWFDGRMAKWLSISAGLASAALARSMTAFVGLPTMDAKAFSAPDENGLADYLFERAKSSRRNCRNGYVHYTLLAQGLGARAAERAAQKMSGAQMAQFVPPEAPAWELFGAYAHYALVERQGADPRSGRLMPPTLRRVLRWTEVANLDELSDLVTRLLVSRPTRRTRPESGESR